MSVPEMRAPSPTGSTLAATPQPASLDNEQPEHQYETEPAEDHISNDNDSAYGDELSSYTSSVTSSIYNFPERYGRTYHAYKEGRYVLPNDERELDRLDISHHLVLRAMHNHLHFAPLPQEFGGRAIDLATGTGIWAIDFADLHPNAIVMGNDLSPTQPQMVPPNAQFFIDDIEMDWTYRDHEKFDFIHARFLAGSIADWPRLMHQTYEHVKPGGWVEFQDWDTWLYSQDGTLPADSALNKFHQMTCGGRHAQGFNMRPGPELEGFVRNAGFVDIEVRKIPLPLGPWPKNKHLKEIGTINLVQMEKAIEGICFAVLPMLPAEAGGPWDIDEIQVFLAEIRKDMMNRKIHGIHDLWVVWARKPI